MLWNKIMNTLNRQKILLSVLGLVVVVGVVYYYNLWNNSSLTDIIVDNSSTDLVGEDILVLVNQLKSVSIDTSLFSNPLFVTLKDLSVTVNPENQARPNPFAPIGNDAGNILPFTRLMSGI